MALLTSFRFETQMTAVAVSTTDEWWGGRHQADFVAAEIVGPGAIADLLAIRFDRRRLEDRVAAGIAPVVDRLALQAAVHARRGPMRTADLAAGCRVTPSGMRRALGVAVDAGLILREGRNCYQTHPAWRPTWDRLVAVELKLQDWRGALEQADAYLQWTNASWVLLATTPPSEALTQARQAGIGLATLATDGSLRKVVAPRPSRRPPQSWAATWASEQAFARGLSAGFDPLSQAVAATRSRATPAGGLAASLLSA